MTVRKSTTDTWQSTVVLTVAASGGVLPLYVIFKGKCDGCIKREFDMYHPRCLYAV